MAILSIHHAIEIMFKSILVQHSEFLIYSDINKMENNQNEDGSIDIPEVLN